jgi:hypothetical protein
MPWDRIKSSTDQRTTESKALPTKDLIEEEGDPTNSGQKDRYNIWAHTHYIHIHAYIVRLTITTTK